MTALPERITITELARRSGVAASALRYYESIGLITAERSAGNQRRYRRRVIRRVSVIRVARTMGVSLEAINEALSGLPEGRDPTPGDWEALSGRWRDELTERIRTLEKLRDELSTCIGCGCLSLDRCGLLNWGDVAAEKGDGPRYLLGDEPTAG